MDREVIYVVSCGSKWKVICKHCNKGAIKDYQYEAIRVAKNHVALLPKGTLSQIRVQSDNGKFRTEWTYGKDPFPPKG